MRVVSGSDPHLKTPRDMSVMVMGVPVSAWSTRAGSTAALRPDGHPACTANGRGMSTMSSDTHPTAPPAICRNAGSE
jgi:hypothetical protein